MKYSELIQQDLDKFKHILVTGPQRSGTTIAAHILAHDLKYEYVDERRVGVRSYTKLFQELTSDRNSVVQGPCFASDCHWIDAPGTAIIFMIRNCDDIVASEKRINWLEAPKELANYFRREGVVSEVRYDAWYKFQKDMMRVPFFELEYDSLAEHPLWVEKEKRKKFSSRQWEIE